MGWEARHEDLLAAVEILDLVPGKSGYPSSDYFRVDAGNESAIRFRTAGSAIAEVVVKGIGEWPYVEPFYIARRQFSPFVAVAREIKKQHNFVFNAYDTYLQVEHGERNVRLNPQPPITGYAEAPQLKNPAKLDFHEDFVAAMNCAASCAASEQKIPECACLYLIPKKDGIQILATDRRAALRIKSRMNIGFKTEVAFPLDMLNVVLVKDAKVKWDERCIVARFENGTVWQTISKKASEEFPLPHFDKVFSQRDKIPRVCTIKARLLAKYMTRMAFYLQFIRKEDWVVNVSGRKGELGMTLLSRLPHCRFEELLPLKVPCQRDFKFDWSLDVVVPIFDYIGKWSEEAHIHLSDDKRASFLICGDLELMLSGKRI